MKELICERDLTKKISHVQFQILSPETIRKTSHVKVVLSELFNRQDRTPLPNGPLDARMGISDKKTSCATCNLTMKDCAGHFGHISLELPVFHVGFFKAIISILQKICKRCSRLLMADEEIAIFTKKFQSKKIEALRARELNKAVADRCRRTAVCMHCGAFNGPVKKVAALKLIHEKYRDKKMSYTADFMTMFDELPRTTIKDLPSLLASHRVQEDLTPLVVRELFRQITKGDCVVLNLATFSRPEHLILTEIPVPPVCIRPSIPAIDKSSNEDDLTMTLREINHSNEILKRKIKEGENNQVIMDSWEHIQLKCALYFNGELSGLSPQQGPKKPLRGFAQRLKGKTGRFRGNLSGKRVDFSSRTVISPDPNLRIDQIAVPKHVCKILTFPERVTKYNRKRLQQFIRNGPDVHPGANHLIRSADMSADSSRAGISSTADKIFLMYGNRDKEADKLRIGDIVERHLIDGDIVLFNRQPSLHKMSIMSHEVKVRPWRTFRFNECVCQPYNADFDGDEMNMHVPQTEEARAEAQILMGTKANLCTPRNGEPLIAAIQDFITGAFLLTQKDVFLTASQTNQLAAVMLGCESRVDLPVPAVIKPVRMWTGKQLITLLLKSNPHAPDMRISLEKPTRASYTKFSKGNPPRYNQVKSLCANDGYLVIFNSVHICGSLDKASVGAGSKRTILYSILRNYGQDAAADAMLKIARVSCSLLKTRGFSIGIGDVTPSSVLARRKVQLLDTGYQVCADLITAAKSGELEPMLGATVAGTLEAKITKELSDIREQAGKALKEGLPRFNAPAVMARCGSKGSDVNMSQMIACVGQQTIGGNRIPNGFENRTFPHFKRHSAEPDAKGFAANSFYSGLRPTEFFFHTMAGREGLVDTAVKTAETGYMSRRLMKALEDLSTDYNLTVQNSSGTMIQFCYGDDGLDPTSMESDEKDKPDEHGVAKGVVCPINLSALWTHVVQSDRSASDQPAMLPFQVQAAAERGLRSQEIFGEVYSSPAARPADSCDAAQSWNRHSFTSQVHSFLMGLCAELARLRVLYGFEAHAEAPAGKTGEGDASMAAEVDKEMEDGSGRMYAVDQLMRVTDAQLNAFLEFCAVKYASASIEPGSAVGAVGAQSIGEPGTQMTLKTFHFAGIASMNVTQGVPRVKEIINASKKISTPVITAPLEDVEEGENEEAFAIRVKARIEIAQLKDIISYVEEVYTGEEVFLLVKIDRKRIKDLSLEITLHSIAEAIVGTSSLKLKASSIELQERRSCLKILPSVPPKTTLFFSMQILRETLLETVVKGDKRLDRCLPRRAKTVYKCVAGNAVAKMADASMAGEKTGDMVGDGDSIEVKKIVLGADGTKMLMIQSDSRDTPVYLPLFDPQSGERLFDKTEGGMKLEVAGTDIASVMCARGVEGTKVSSNHVMEVEKALGIEAARNTIMFEIDHTMTKHGMTIDPRHVMLLADLMTFKGEVLGITRFGIAKMKESVFMLASFEKTADHLYDAALHGTKDPITGVSECIILGSPMQIGTGLFKVLQSSIKTAPLKARPLLFDDPKYHVPFVNT